MRGSSSHRTKDKGEPHQRSVPVNANAGPSAFIVPVLLCLIVAGATLFAHWPALNARALNFDDGQYLTTNSLVQHLSWQSARRFLTEVLEPSTVQGYYQTLAMISLMLDYAVAGQPDNLQPFHRTSLILHAANTALVFVLLYLLVGRPWIAAGVALLFGVHLQAAGPGHDLRRPAAARTNHPPNARCNKVTIRAGSGSARLKLLHQNRKRKRPACRRDNKNQSWPLRGRCAATRLLSHCPLMMAGSICKPVYNDQDCF